MCGPTQATASSSATSRATSATSSNVTASSAAIAASGSIVLAEQDRLLRGVARDRVRVLERQHARAGGVGAGALDLLLRRALARAARSTISRMRVYASTHFAESRPGRELQDRHVGAVVGDRVHRVGEAALLADLVEQARAHRAAEQRRVDRQRGALRAVGRVDRRPVGHPQVRLVRVALLDERARRAARARPRTAPARAASGSGRRARRAPPFAGRCSRLPTTNAPPRPPGPAALAEGDDRLARERVAQVLHRARAPVRPSGWSPNAALVDQVLGDGRRLVVGARDLLDHDAALAVELLGVEPRPPDEVASAGRSPPAPSPRAR